MSIAEVSPPTQSSASAGASNGGSDQLRGSGRGKCPVDHSQLSGKQQHEIQGAPKPGKCPVQHGPVNELNLMPDLAQVKQPEQSMDLPLDRVESSIPSGDGGKWMYPSPQQFYNALCRKGWETPEEEIEVMVDIHNHLNEEAWGEILKWEALHKDECKQVRLQRLRGRPNDLSPKAWISGWVWGSPRPFDRHDWFIDRCGKQVRYVIDYYSGPDERDNPVFFLDVRPALDSPTAIFDRIRQGFKSWWEAR